MPQPRQSSRSPHPAAGRALHFAWLLVGVLSASSIATAQSPRLVVDLEPTTGSRLHNNPSWIIPHHDLIYFFGQYSGTFESGHGLWESDATTAGTRLVVPMGPILHGENKQYSPRELTSFGEYLVFAAHDEDTGFEPWISDGTTTGTRLLRDIAPNDPSTSGSLSGTAGFTVMGNQLFFIADDGVHGRELWVTDGTSGGTRLVRDLNTTSGKGSFATDRAWLKATELGLLIVADAGNEGPELWLSQGSAVGTHRLAQLDPETYTNADPVALDGWIYTSELLEGPDSFWRLSSDGSVHLAFYPIRAGETVVFGDHIFFAGQQQDEPPAPWVTDRTASGTHRLLIDGFTLTNPREFSPSQFRLWFVCDVFDPASKIDKDHVELIATDGTASNTRPVLAPYFQGDYDDVARVAHLVDLRNLTPFGAHLYLTALGIGSFPTVVNGSTFDFWTYPDNHARTFPERRGIPWEDQILFAGYADPYGVGGKTAGIGTYGSDPWVSDGTDEGTFSLGDQDWSPQSAAPEIFVHDGHSQFLMIAGVDSYKRNIYRSAGTSESTHAVVHPELENRESPHGTRLNGAWYFSMQPYFSPPGRFRMGESTAAVEYLGPGRYLGKAGDILYYTGHQYDDLWRTDGSEQGTWPLQTSGQRLSPVISPLSGLWFEVGEGTTTLWHSDGTTEGTRALWATDDRVSELVPGVRNAYVLVGSEPHYEIRALDPVTSSTRVMCAFRSERQEPIDWIREVNGELFYILDDVLWRADGHGTTGTLLHSSDVIEPAETAQWPYPVPPEALPVRSWPFFSRPAEGQRELWFTDGTPGGTRPLLGAGFELVGPHIVFVEPENRWYFSGYDPAHGWELWITDGTAEGTRLAVEITPGPEGSSPIDLVAVGRFLYFNYWTPEHGRELWVVDRLAHTGARRWGGYQ